jgi:hypothetical protein
MSWLRLVRSRPRHFHRFLVRRLSDEDFPIAGNTQQHLFGQIPQLLFGAFELVREVVEVGEGAVVVRNSGAQGLDEGGIGGYGE